MKFFFLATYFDVFFWLLILIVIMLIFFDVSFFKYLHQQHSFITWFGKILVWLAQHIKLHEKMHGKVHCWMFENIAFFCYEHIKCDIFCYENKILLQYFFLLLLILSDIFFKFTTFFYHINTNNILLLLDFGKILVWLAQHIKLHEKMHGKVQCHYYYWKKYIYIYI
jgi:hypothetical protein